MVDYREIAKRCEGDLCGRNLARLCQGHDNVATGTNTMHFIKQVTHLRVVFAHLAPCTVWLRTRQHHLWALDIQRPRSAIHAHCPCSAVRYENKADAEQFFCACALEYK
jgi:hypothetical protein